MSGLDTRHDEYLQEKMNGETLPFPILITGRLSTKRRPVVEVCFSGRAEFTAKIICARAGRKAVGQMSFCPWWITSVSPAA